MNKKIHTFLGSIMAALLITTTVGCAPKDNPSDVKPSENPTTSEQAPAESSVTSETPVTSEVPPSSEGNTSTEVKQTLAEKYNCITLLEANNIATEAGDAGTAEPYNVAGIIQNINNPTYGEMTIKDDTGSLYIYGINDWSTMEAKPTVNDEIALSGILKTYSGKVEMGKADLLEYVHIEVPVDETQYIASKIDEARGKSAGSKVKLTGVVANITYGQGKTPNGYYLVDDTNSIYVYDKDNIANIKVGNTITILAERANYISSKEIDNANKYGYTGCIQVTNVILKENDNKVSDYNKSWIKDSTVKEIVEAPTSNNITTTIFKVTGIINKVVNPGFTNYYINDLDNKTGSYVYTSSNGSDFTWLDEFDKQICTIYLSPINCKSTSSGVTYRLMPITVSKSDFLLSDDKVSEFVLTYHIMDKFLTTYNSDPSLELPKTASDEILNYKDVALTYTSSDTNVIDFADNVENIIMHVKKSGVATITATATYKGHVANKTLQITVDIITIDDATNVKTAIDAEKGATVKVHGIIVASVVNKDGFYIGDETGVIAVLTTKETLNTLHLGNEIYIEGTRDFYKKPDKPVLGQSCINNAKLLLNKFGEHEYSKASFMDAKIEDIVSLSVNEDHTAQVYTVKGSIVIEKTNYYTKMDIVSGTDDTTKLALYSSSAKQYSWLEQFKDSGVITLEVMLCNWNDKAAYKACVLSASDGTKTVINNLNFANNA